MNFSSSHISMLENSCWLTWASIFLNIFFTSGCCDRETKARHWN
uniref:Uncharacterized protein n=1 Tax=Arundo donax TaxID=35708 RepID=A0A0A9BPJ0_ARUDO